MTAQAGPTDAEKVIITDAVEARVDACIDAARRHDLEWFLDFWARVDEFVIAADGSLMDYATLGAATSWRFRRYSRNHRIRVLQSASTPVVTKAIPLSPGLPFGEVSWLSTSRRASTVLQRTCLQRAGEVQNSVRKSSGSARSRSCAAEICIPKL
jgi:hypothetical protein